MIMKPFTFVFALFSLSAHAADLWTESASNSSPAVNIFFEGKVAAGDYVTLRSLLKENGPKVERIYLFSPGGDLAEAMQISQLVKRLQLRTTGPEVGYDDAVRPFPECRSAKPRNPGNCLCASSCFVIWAAGGERDRSVLAVHRPAFEQESFGALPLHEAEARYDKLLGEMYKYIDTLRVPIDLKEKMFSTPARDAYIFESPEEMTGLSPAFDEWIAARCKPLSQADESTYYDLEVRSNQDRATAAEKDQIATMAPRVKSAAFCRALETLERRFQLFSDYFGVDYERLLRNR